jgi:hypothetical protein
MQYFNVVSKLDFYRQPSHSYYEVVQTKKFSWKRKILSQKTWSRKINKKHIMWTYFPEKRSRNKNVKTEQAWTFFGLKVLTNICVTGNPHNKEALLEWD